MNRVTKKEPLSLLGSICRAARQLLCCMLIGSFFGLASAEDGFLPPLQDRESIHVVSDNNFPPYLFLNAEGKVEGFLVDLWQLWEKKSGVKVKLTEVPPVFRLPKGGFHATSFSC